MAAFPQLTVRTTTDYAIPCGRQHVKEASALEALANNTRLTTLSLHRDVLSASDAVTQILIQNSTLTSLNLPGLWGAARRGVNITPVDITPIARALTQNSTLTQLDASFNGHDDDDGVSSLAVALTHNSGLKFLRIENGQIGSAGANALAQMLIVNSSLSRLSLSLVPIRGEGDDFEQVEYFDEGAGFIAEAIMQNRSLEALDLQSIYLDLAGPNALALALIQNSTLTSLSLMYAYDLSERSIVVIAEALSKNDSLRRLDLSHTSMGDPGVIALAKALTQNTSLTSLDLTANLIGNEGAASLAQALTTNRTLLTLSLGQNTIDDDGAVSFAQALLLNSTLITLNLGSNRFGDEGVASLTEVFRQNSTLETLDLVSTQFNEARATSIEQALAHNQTLTYVGYLPQYYGFVQSDAGRRERIESLLLRNKQMATVRHLPLEARCARIFARLVFESYPQESKGAVYCKICAYSGQPNESSFGEKNVFNVEWKVFLESVSSAGFDLQKGVELMLQDLGKEARLARYVTRI